MCFKFSKCNYARTSSSLPCYNRDREPTLDQKGGKNIAFRTALLIIRILCFPELVSTAGYKRSDKVDPKLSRFFHYPDLLLRSPSNSRSVATFY